MEVFIPITNGKGRAVLPYVNRKCLVELVECNVRDTRRYKDLGVPVDNRRFIPEAIMYKYLAHGDSVTVDVVSDFRWAGGSETPALKSTFVYVATLIGDGFPDFDADDGAYYVDKLNGNYYGPYQNEVIPYWGAAKSFGTGVVIFKDSYYDEPDDNSKWKYKNASSNLKFLDVNSLATVWNTSDANVGNTNYEPARVLGYRELVDSGRNADDFYRVYQNEWITGANWLENTSNVNNETSTLVYPPGSMTPQAMPCPLDDPGATSFYTDDVSRRRFGGFPFYNPVSHAPKCGIITDDYTYRDGMTLAQFQAISQLIRYTTTTTGVGPVTFTVKTYSTSGTANPLNPVYYTNSGGTGARLVETDATYLYSKFAQSRDPDASYYEYFNGSGWVSMTASQSNDPSTSLGGFDTLRARAIDVLRDLVDITVAGALRMLRNGIGIKLFKREFIIPPGSYALEGSMSFLSQRYRTPNEPLPNRWAIPQSTNNPTSNTTSPLGQMQVGVAVTSSNGVSTPVISGAFTNTAAFPGGSTPAGLTSSILGDATISPALFAFGTNQASLAYGYGTSCPLLPWHPLTNRISPYVTNIATSAADDIVDHLYSFVNATSGAWVRNVTMNRFHARSSVNSTSQGLVSMRDMPHAWRTDLGDAQSNRTHELKVLIGNPTRASVSATSCQIGYDIATRRSQGQWVANSFSVQRLHLTPILEAPYETITLNDTGTVCFENVSSIGPMAYTFIKNFTDTGVQGAVDSFSPFIPAKDTNQQTQQIFRLRTYFTNTNFYDFPSLTTSTFAGSIPNDVTITSQLKCDGPIRDGQLRYPYVPKTTRVASSVYPSWVAHVRGGVISTSTVSAYMSGYVKLRLSFLDVTVETTRHVSTVSSANFVAL
jgi:hypothetical protein